MANQADHETMHAITWTSAIHATLLNSSTQLPTGGGDLAASMLSFYQDIFISTMSDPNLQDRHTKNLPCSIYSQLQVWRHDPFWLVMPYAIAVGVTIPILLVAMHDCIQKRFCRRCQLQHIRHDIAE